MKDSFIKEDLVGKEIFFNVYKWDDINFIGVWGLENVWKCWIILCYIFIGGFVIIDCIFYKKNVFEFFIYF